MDANNPASPSHLRALDGLRGVACLAVVAHHCYFSAGQYTWPFGIPKLFSYGYLGVEIFFVLSGFCLAYPLLKQPSRPDDWARYARHRFRRIFPPYWAAYLLFFTISLLIRWLQIEPFAQTQLLPVPNLRQFLYTFFLVAVWFNPVFWTLAVEVRWYALLPFCIKAARRVGVVILLFVSVIVSAGFAMIEKRLPGRIQFVVGPLPLYLPLFVMGIALAALYARKRAMPLSLLVSANRVALIAVIGLIFWQTPAHPAVDLNFRRIIPGGLLASSIMLATLYDPLVKRLMCARPLPAIGLFSYSLYLLHWPLIELCYQKTHSGSWSEWKQCLFYYGLIFPASVLCAYFFYLVFERPFLRMNRNKMLAGP
jgi:peptidoglycan/LPS O-acetylase OafA/YrhL